MIYAVPAHRRHAWSTDLSCWEVECIKCRTLWPCDDEFYERNRWNKSYPDSQCKACRREAKRRSRERCRRAAA